jgi:hypothetical protein
MTSVFNLCNIDTMINEREGVSDKRIISRNPSARTKPAPMLLYKPQIPHVLT